MAQRLTQRWNTGYWAVAVFALVESAIEGFAHRRGGMKVGFAKFEVNNGTTGAFEFFGAGINGEGAFPAHHRHA